MNTSFRPPALSGSPLLFALVFLAMASLSGCQATGPVSPGSPYYRVPTGSTITLNRTLRVPAHSAGVYIQDGRVIEHKLLNPVNQYYVYCRLEVDDVKDTAQTIRPDTFTVRRVEGRREDVSRETPLYASVGIGIGMGFGGDDDAGPSMENWSMDIYLHSAYQPQVRRLSCEHWVYSYEGEYPTVSEIKKTLGDVMTLKLAQ